MKIRSRQIRWIFGLVKLLFASTLLIAFLTPSWASAQSTPDPWAKPLNLSHSGVATNPKIVIDSDGVIHVIWQDDQANFSYSEFDGDQWSAPVTSNLNRLFMFPSLDEPADPLQLANYTGPNPLFIASPEKRIFAFWITPQGRINLSNVENRDFKDNAKWGFARLITLGAASFAAGIDARGDLHVAFLRTEDDPVNPPGIYYTRSKTNGGDWSKPVLLYQSSYFRGLSEGEANLSLATAGTEDAPQVYIAWDNRRRKEVLLAQSLDGGQTWDPPALIAGPAPGSGLAGPFNILVGANQDSIVLTWQDGQAGGACSLISKYSRDAGESWSAPQPMIEDLLGCAETNEFVRGLSNRVQSELYFLTETKSQIFLSAWNGRQWSQPQAQPALSGFEEPEIYTEVTYGCHQAALLGERLYVVGCDQGQGGDVWVTNRDLGSEKSSLKPPVWSQITTVTDDKLTLQTFEFAYTDDGLIHAFLTQPRDPNIYYANWDGESWSRIAPVLNLPDGESGRPAIAAGPGNELFLVAPNKRGSLYFSRVISGGAGLKSNWSTPTKLEITHDGEIGSADIGWDSSGTIYAAYSVPVNDERGIYLVQSKDQGTTWSEPVQVFNGAAADFNFVGAPSLQISADDALHIVWNVQSIQGDGLQQPLSLYYSRSSDGGSTFNDAELVVEEPVVWQEIMTDANGNLHLLWQPQDTPTTLWDQISLDGGQTWQYPQGLPDAGRLTAVTTDPAGRLQLVGVGTDAVGHWLWNDGRWQSETPLIWSLAPQQESPVKFLGVAVDKQGKMVVVLAIPTGAGDAAGSILYYATRTLELLPKQATAQGITSQTLPAPALTPTTPTPVLSPTPEGLLAPTNTVDNGLINSQSQTDGNQANGRISPFTIALIPVALLLFVVLGIVVRRSVRAADR